MEGYPQQDLIASIFYAEGKYSDAIKFLRDLYMKRSSTLGVNDPDTILCLSNLASALGRAGYLAEAQAAFRDVYTSRLGALGKQHKDTLLANLYLGVCHKQQGDYDGAESEIYTAMSGFVVSFGNENFLSGEAAFALAIANIQLRVNGICFAYFLLKQIAWPALSNELGEEHQESQHVAYWIQRCEDFVSNGVKAYILRSVTEQTDKYRVPTLEFLYSLDDMNASTALEEEIDQKAGGLETPTTSPTRPRNTTYLSAKIDSPVPVSSSKYTPVSQTSKEPFFTSKSKWINESKCQICTKSYSMMRRQHHCRCCFISCCDSCSDLRVHISAYKDKVRSCVQCYDRGIN